MEQELKRYLIDKCRDWMLPEEVEALDQIALSHLEQDHRLLSPPTYQRIKVIYGINCKRTGQLMLNGKEKLEDAIAARLLIAHKELLNNCRVCGQLARIPKNIKCRLCQHRWFEIANIMVNL